MGIGWRSYLLLLDTIQAVTLFFLAGSKGESDFIHDEFKDYKWDDATIDLLGLSLLRSAVLALCFYLAEQAAQDAGTVSWNPSSGKAPSDGTALLQDGGKKKDKLPGKGWCMLAVVVALGSVGYSGARAGTYMKEHPTPHPNNTIGFGPISNASDGNKSHGGMIGNQQVDVGLIVTSVIVSFIELIVALTFSKHVKRVHAAVLKKLAGGDNDDDEFDENGKPKKAKKASLKRLLGLARPEYHIIGMGFCCLLVSTTSSIATPLYFGKVIDAASPQHHNPALLNKCILDLGIIFVAGSLASFLRMYCFQLAGQRFVARIRVDVFRAIASQEIAFFDTTRTGELTNRLSSDTQVIQNACTVNLSGLARYLTQILGSLAIMFVVNWKLTMVLLSVVPAVSIGAVIYGKKVKTLRTKFQDSLAEASTTAEESISNIRTVRTFSREDKCTDEYAVDIQKSYVQGASLAVWIGGFAGFAGLLVQLAILLVLWYGGTLVRSGELTTGSLTAFMLYTLTVAMAFAFISSLYGDFMQALGASGRLFELMDRKPLLNTKGGKSYATIKPTISMDNVGFTYPSRPDSAVLTGITLDVEEGSVVALVGPSGGGKSTIVSLIERLYDVGEGTIRVGGELIKDLDPVWLHSKMSIVSQEPDLFCCSIADNIRYGAPNATDKEVEEAATKANAHNFISDFKDGYKTMVGERGIRLSGGQKQRVAIARALIVNPAILLLDEATSALDAESEHLVQEAVDRAMKGRTVVVIAHRLSTVRNATKVVVIDNGSIVESGTHDQLIASDGVYKKLVARQLLGGPEAAGLTAPQRGASASSSVDGDSSAGGAASGVGSIN